MQAEEDAERDAAVEILERLAGDERGGVDALRDLPGPLGMPADLLDLVVVEAEPEEEPWVVALLALAVGLAAETLEVVPGGADPHDERAGTLVRRRAERVVQLRVSVGVDLVDDRPPSTIARDGRRPTGRLS